MSTLSWTTKPSPSRGVSGISLVVVACCGTAAPSGARTAPDATGDGAMLASGIDSGGPPGDATSVEADGDGAVDDATASMTLADSGPSPLDSAPSGPSGPCGAVVQAHAIEGFNHVAVCSRVTYATKPPSSGDHYPVWAAYRTYASAIPEGYWVHDLEHGAVVLTYNCPAGCTADVAAAQAWIDGLPGDPLCNPALGEARVRVVMTPDPNLDVKFAASSWGWTLRADCFDPVAFAAFERAHYDQGGEVTCSQGQDLSSGTADGCGE